MELNRLYIILPGKRRRHIANLVILISNDTVHVIITREPLWRTREAMRFTPTANMTRRGRFLLEFTKSDETDSDGTGQENYGSDDHHRYGDEPTDLDNGG